MESGRAQNYREMVLIFALVVLVALGWTWYSNHQKATQDAAEAEQVSDYEGLIKDYIVSLSEGAETLKAIKEPASDASDGKTTKQVFARLTELQGKMGSSSLQAAKKSELDKRYEGELNAAWNRWMGELHRISDQRTAGAKEAAEKLKKQLEELKKSK